MSVIGNDVQVRQLELARSGNQGAFEALIEPYRRELVAHCYRILGSFEDAEDMLQETFLRAWKHLDSFEGRSSLRSWLYRIATNACLDGLDKRKRRGLPRDLYAHANPSQPLPAALQEATWVEPFLDEWIDDQPDAYPEARYDQRESITLAFVTALQILPGRQRAALLLRDVMGWSTEETAGILGMTVPAINSLVERARLGLKGGRDLHSQVINPTNEPYATLLAHYVSAWEKADAAALVATLREDIALTMPPLPVWFEGRTDVYNFQENSLFKRSEPVRVRLIPLLANGSPAFAIYQKDQNEVFRAAGLHVLTIHDDKIAIIDDFLTSDNHLFNRFGLPLIV